MADWQRKLDLKDVWDTNDVHLIAKTASDRLKELAPLNDDALDEEREVIAYDFETVAADQDACVDDFDEVMARLYDWGDTHLDGTILGGKKVCWIATF